jgi:hypothetical protein
MPRRAKRYIGPGKTLVNGGRGEFVGEAENVPLWDVIDRVPVDFATTRRKVAAHVEKFPELALVHDRDRLIDDLTYQCESAQGLRLDLLIEGPRTKPDEWTTQILAFGMAAVLQSHGLEPAISEYERQGEKVQSLYLRLIPELIRIAGFRAPKDIKGLCLRAQAHITCEKTNTRPFGHCPTAKHS